MAEFAVGANKMVVNKQFNSPINLYSSQALNETLAKQATVLNNGAIGIDFHQLAAPNLAKSAVLRMLEEEHETSRGETMSREPAKLPLGATRWPPPSPPTSPPTRHRIISPPEKRMGAIAWPPRSTATTTTNPITNEQTNSSWRRRCSEHQGGVKRVAWPPPPDPSIICALDSQNQQGEPQKVNGVTLEANPPAPLYYSPPPQQGGEQPPRWQASPVDYSNSAPVTVFSIPSVNSLPPPPSTVTLRPKAPVSQPPPPVYKSQPAIQKQQHAYMPLKMRGDQKWPPAEHKANQDAEQQAILARGPAVRPRLVRKDYSSFFAQHSLTPTYAGYRAPPGTQHYDEQGRPINGTM